MGTNALMLIDRISFERFIKNALLKTMLKLGYWICLNNKKIIKRTDSEIHVFVKFNLNNNFTDYKGISKPGEAVIEVDPCTLGGW